MKAKIGLVVLVALIILLFVAGHYWGGLETVNTLYWVAFISIPVLCVFFFIIRRKTPDSVANKVRRELESIRKPYSDQRATLVAAYNSEADPIKEDYRQHATQPNKESACQMRLEALKPRYIEQENNLQQACKASEQRYIDDARQRYALKRNFFPESLWRVLILLPMALLVGLFFYGCGASTADDGSKSSPGNGWTAENLHMVHLDDETQYVCNPDNLLSAETLNHMNNKLLNLDRDLGIESVIIVVNHIANDDPFRLTQDIFERYGVGRDDRGLVIAIGWQDHNMFIATGSNLEADLTDVECDRLQTRYFDAYAKAGQINKATTSLIDALCAHLANKQMPRAVAAKDVPASSKDTFWNLMLVSLLFIIGWIFCLFFFWDLTDDRLAHLRALGLLEGPWHNDRVKKTEWKSHSPSHLSSTSDWHGYGRRDDERRSSRSWWSGGSSSGSSSRGGSFGGGRSSGGGAGHRW